MRPAEAAAPPTPAEAVLVTGAAGWVGQALCQALLDRGQAVTPCARMPARLAGGRLATLAVGDIAQATDWRAALEGCAAVVHLAARVHAPAAPDAAEWHLHRRINTEATLALAQQAAQAGVRRFVFVSSLKVHGDTTAPGQPARPDDAVDPVDPYGRSKWEAEQGLRALSQPSGMEVVVVRPPLVYGPGVRANMGALLRAVDRGLPLPLGAVRNNRRSLLALDNLVDLLLRCLDHPAAAGGTFLASDGEDMSTAELLEAVADALDRPALLLPIPPSWLSLAARVAGRPSLAARLLGSLQADISLTRQVLDWAPPVRPSLALRAMAAAWRARGGWE